MSLVSSIRAVVHRMGRLPWRRIVVIGSVASGTILYVILFVLPRTVTFSYAGDTCLGGLTFFPSLQRTVGTKDYRLSSQGEFRIGNMPLVSTRTCINAAASPVTGRIQLANSPFGSIIFRTHINLIVPQAPTIDQNAFKKPIPISKPLVLPLSASDSVHRYELRVGDKTAVCMHEVGSVQCNLAPLQLTQGQSYTLEVTRSFQGADTKSILTKQVTTLSPVQVTDSSIKQNETIYDKPRTITLTTDKQLTRGEVLLEKHEGDKVSIVKVVSTFDNKSLQVAVDSDLEREATYALKLDHVQASDGSTLIEPYTLTFTVSGGPKVVNVSIPKTGVGTSATAIVTFDQEISSTQDINKLVTFTGGSAVITRRPNQIVYTLQNVPKCTDFSLTIGKGLLSKYDIASTASWSYGARTVCHTVTTVGYSSKGRPINAYYFGSGDSTVLFTGAIHGSEASASYILNDFIADLEANARSLPANRQIVVVPTLNPDGLAAGTRDNAHGVNLNRNFATSDWKSDINDTDGASPGGGGATPMSESETQAIAALSSQLHPRLVLSYHAVGSVAIANQVGDSGALAAKYASLVGYSNGTGNSDEIFNYEITGTYDDWLAQKLGVPSIVVELGSYTYRNYGYHKSAFWAMING